MATNKEVSIATKLSTSVGIGISSILFYWIVIKESLGHWRVLNYNFFNFLFESTVENDYILLSVFLFLVVVGGLVVGVIAYEFFDWLGLLKATPVTLTAIISEKHYTPESYSSGVGVSVSPSGGGAAPVFLSNRTEEDFIVGVKLFDNNFKIIRLSVSEETFDSLKVGDTALVSYRVSEFSNVKHWSSQINRI
jgi:hypothetical protein